ncbi:MAG: BolA family protein [Wenzhouxiangella sp.]|nr:BolA family protein [Wenzhouxiangella sp.]
MTTERVATIRERLESALAPVEMTVIDESHLHVGHAGARDGRGHFKVRVVSTAFSGLPRLARHRKVYDAVGEMMTTDIHALNIEAVTPDEA